MATRINATLDRQLASSDIPREHIQEKRTLKSDEDTNCNPCLEPEDLHNLKVFLFTCNHQADRDKDHPVSNCKGSKVALPFKG